MARNAAVAVAARRTPPGRPAGSRLLTLLILALSWGGCDEELDPHSPEGALAMLIEAYRDGKGERIYAMTSKQTHLLIKEAWEGLHELKGLVERELPLGTRETAQKSSGIGLLREVADETGLFVSMARLDALDMGSGEVFGAQPVKTEVDQDKGSALITTEASQTFELVREEDGVWRSRHLEQGLERRVAVLRDNLQRVKAYAQAVKERDQKLQELLAGTGASEQGSAAAQSAAAPDPENGVASKAAAPGKVTGKKAVSKDKGKSKGKVRAKKARKAKKPDRAGR